MSFGTLTYANFRGILSRSGCFGWGVVGATGGAGASAGEGRGGPLAQEGQDRLRQHADRERGTEEEEQDQAEVDPDRQENRLAAAYLDDGLLARLLKRQEFHGTSHALPAARPSEGRRDLVKFPPDGVHVDFLELGMDAVGEEDIDAPAVRVDPEGRPGETGVPDRPLRQCAVRGASGTGGDQKAQ